jgi:hypothetical protein
VYLEHIGDDQAFPVINIEVTVDKEHAIAKAKEVSG